MSDEGVGTSIIERFLAQSSEYPSVDFIDAGTGGMSILHLIAGRQKAIFIDCAYMGTTAGTIKKFKPDEVISVKKLAHQSLHEADVLKVIDLAEHLNQSPQRIVIFGIEPESTDPSDKLSETVESKMNDFVAAISEELAI